MEAEAKEIFYTVGLNIWIYCSDDEKQKCYNSKCNGCEWDRILRLRHYIAVNLCEPSCCHLMIFLILLSIFEI